MCMLHVVGKHTPGSFMAVITDSMRDPSSPNVFCPFTQYDEKPVSRQQSACIVRTRCNSYTDARAAIAPMPGMS